LLPQFAQLRALIVDLVVDLVVVVDLDGDGNGDLAGHSTTLRVRQRCT
jgi:hypothetical protein